MIGALAQSLGMGTNDLTQSAPHPVANHGVADLPTHGVPHARRRAHRRQNDEDEVASLEAPPLLLHPKKLSALGERGGLGEPGHT